MKPTTGAPLRFPLSEVTKPSEMRTDVPVNGMVDAPLKSNDPEPSSAGVGSVINTAFDEPRTIDDELN
jgi:hypothetical protein